MKKLNKVLVSLFAMLIGAVGFVNAAAPGWINNGVNTQTNAANFGGIAGNILGIIQSVGVIVGIIVIATLGIKFMTSGPEEKAKIKDNLVVVLVGFILLFGALTIVKILAGISI